MSVMAFDSWGAGASHKPDFWSMLSARYGEKASPFLSKTLMRLLPVVNGLVVATMLYFVIVVLVLRNSISTKEWDNSSPFKSAARFWPLYLAGFGVSYWLAQ